MKISILRLSGLTAAFCLALPALLSAADPVTFPALAVPEPDHIPPKLVQRVEPTYPSGVTERHERRVYVAFLVADDGTVRSASAMFGPPAPFAEAAVAAVTRWKFEPGRMVVNRRAVWTQMTVELWFKPPPASSP